MSTTFAVCRAGLLDCLVFMTLLPVPAGAQGGLGSITGSVIDKSGAPIRGAEVRLTELSTSARRSTTTNDYSLSVQRQLPGRMVFDVACVGNLQRHQTITLDMNSVLPGTAFRPAFVEPGNVGYNFRGAISSSNPGPALPGSNTVNEELMRLYRGLSQLKLPANVANAWRGGVGLVNLTTVDPNRIVEIGMRLRF